MRVGEIIIGIKLFIKRLFRKSDVSRFLSYLVKSMLKSPAIIQLELESTVRTDGGRLFHTSGPQTEKVRLPNWVRVLCIAAALVVVERSCRWESVELNATRSANYAGQRRWRAWCIRVATLKVMRCLTGTKCRSLRTVVMLDRRSRPSTRRAAAFCARRSGNSVDAGRPVRMALQ